MDGVIVLETLEFTPTFWWVLFKVFCCGGCFLTAVALFGLGDNSLGC